MRDRLVAAFVCVALLTMLALGVARAYAVAGLVRDDATAQLDRSAGLVSALLAERERTGASISPAYLHRVLEPHQQVRYVAADGRQVVAGSRFPAGAAKGALTRTTAVPGGGTVTVRQAASVVNARISDALRPLVLLSMATLATLVAVGFVVARWLADPFQELARVARELGRGRFDLQVPRFAMSEANTVGRALETSASQLHDLVVREREFAANASHQLRTPITALRLELEDLSLWKETPQPVAEQLQRAIRELDRLSESVANLLALARGRRRGTVADTDLSKLVSEAADRWRQTAAVRKRKVSVTPGDPLLARVAPGGVEQILDGLIDNALRHGTGEVTVDVTEFEEHTRLRVRDEGTARLSDAVFRRTGEPAPTKGIGSGRTSGNGQVIGLAAASEIADALGAHLTLDRAPFTSFSLMLPRA
jgi:signal transduction histidine kinase